MSRYFIGIGLPKKEEGLILFVKRQFAETKGKTAPPHITLTEPFDYEDEIKLVDDLKNWAEKQKSVTINIKEVGNFRQPTYGTVFLAPTEKDGLNDLRASLIKEVDGLFDRGNFEPHLTIVNGVDLESLEDSVERLKVMGIKLKLIVDKVVL